MAGINRHFHTGLMVAEEKAEEKQVGSDHQRFLNGYDQVTLHDCDFDCRYPWSLV